MYSVYLRGERAPMDADSVKITLIIYRTGYIRSEKLVLITGPYAEWNKKARCFTPTSADNITKNKLLQQERTKYLKIAERWEYSGKNWEPRELAHYYDTSPDTRKRSVFIVDVFDRMIEEAPRPDGSATERSFLVQPWPDISTLPGRLWNGSYTRGMAASSPDSAFVTSTASS